MIQYLKAENLKFKRTFLRKSLVIIPIFNIFISFIINPTYFTTTTFNLWTVIFMPLMIALLCSLSDQKEKKASNYNLVFSFPIEPKIIWYTKIAIIGLYSLVALTIFLTFMLIIGVSIPGLTIIKFQYIEAISIIWISTIWQIPFCLFLAQKFGFLTSIIFNFLGNFGLIFMASESFWWLSPWGWSVRMMSPILGIHPNGLSLEKNSPLLNPNVIPIGIVLSTILFVLLIYMTGRKFSCKSE